MVTSYNSYYTVLRFYHDLYEELDYHRKSRKYLTLEEYKTLKAYYHSLDSRTVNHIARSEASFLEQVKGYIVGSAELPRVLDAGCGLGSEAIFFSLLGADVVGVDLGRERLVIANKRIRYYQEKYNSALSIKLIQRNILTFVEHGKFDLVWSNQSISHIHPVRDFLKIARENLKEGGYLMICDSNSLNPYVHLWASLAHRRRGSLTVVKDPDTLKLIPYAQEIFLIPSCLNKLLREAGFETQSLRHQGFVPLRFRVLGFTRFMESALARLPFIRMIGASYMITSRRRGEESEK